MIKYAFLLLLLVPRPQEKVLRVGIIGLDTSHVIAFTQLLNDEKHGAHITGAKVVAAYKGGSADIKESSGRIDAFTKTLQERWGVELVDSVAALCEKVDCVLLESVDGRPHLEQVKPVLAAKKRVFIDKPLAGTWKDGVEIARLSKEHGTPFFSASSIRFYETIIKAKKDEKIGKIVGCESYGHYSTEPHHPDLFWYGVHAVEGLYSVMGPGCESVTRVDAEDMTVVVGKWKDGRIGTFRGMKKAGKEYGVTVFGEKGEKSSLGLEGRNGYAALVVEIVKFFQGGEPPVSPEECVEVLAFMQAADLSKERGGAPVKLTELK